MSAGNNQPKDQPLAEVNASNESLDNEDAPLTTPHITSEQLPSAENTPFKPTLLYSEPQPQNMEVHHHGHVHHEKKWKEYLFQFFMLFLAVFCGFLAEYQLEHLIENQRAKQYASFLYNDLIKDTASLKERTEFMVRGTKALDTLILLLQTFKDNDSTTAKIYALSAYFYSGAFFSATTSTIEQLKNSGSLRYFHSNHLIHNFSRYDTDLQRLKAVEDRNAYLNEEIRKFLAQFLDLKSISRFTVTTAVDSLGFVLSQPAISGTLKLYNRRPEQRVQYANLCALKQIDWSTRISLQTRILTSARSLITSLKEEYHLE